MLRRHLSPSRPFTHRSLGEGGPFFLALLSWGLLAALVIVIDPASLVPIYLAPFWMLLWLALFYTTSLIFRRPRRGFLYATSVTVYMALRYLGIGHPIVGLFLLGIAIAIDVYLSPSS